jgi:hypothetical protein
MTLLADILLSSNKYAQTGWAAKTGRYWDITLSDYGPGDWFVACNVDKVGPGTIGWSRRTAWGSVTAGAADGSA